MPGRRFILVLVQAVALLLIAPVLSAAETDHLVVYGASGRIGQVIVTEALQRGYRVSGVSRRPGNLQFEHGNFRAVKGDLMDVDNIRQTVKGARAIIISVNARAPDNRPENSLLVKVTRNMMEALSGLEEKPYLLQVGGANLMYGSNYQEVKKNMGHAPFNFDEGSEMHAVLFGHQMSVDMYRASELDWTVIAPPMRIMGIYRELDDSSSKGSYHASASGPVIAADGSETIYVRDFARAAIDEIENRQFNGKVFGVGYRQATGLPEVY